MDAIRLAVIAALLAPQGAFAGTIAARTASTRAAGTAGAAAAVRVTQFPSFATPALLPSAPSPALAALPGTVAAPDAPPLPSPGLTAPISRGESRSDARSAVLPDLGRLARDVSAAADAPQAPLDAFFDVRVFLTRHGQDPVALKLEQLGERLTADASFRDALNREGRVRVVVNRDRPGALSPAGVEALGGFLRSRGVTAPVAVEKIPIDWERKTREPSAAADAATAHAVRGPLRWATAPFREAAYLARSLAAAYEKPTLGETLGGLLTKGPAIALGVAWWGLQFLPASPVRFETAPGLDQLFGAFASVWSGEWAHTAVFLAVIGIMAVQDLFHGVWVATWQNLQNIIERQRGLTYQMTFNFFYSQLTGAIYRALTWVAIAGVVAPWTFRYWADIGFMTVVGTFFGVLGYIGLNTLYNRGRIQRGARSGVQQLRDVFFLLTGLFFGSGNLVLTYALFFTQQSLDFLLYQVSRRSRARPIVYAADADVAATAEFERSYPIRPGVEASPLRQALEAVWNVALIQLPLKAAKALWRRLRGGRA